MNFKVGDKVTVADGVEVYSFDEYIKERGHTGIVKMVSGYKEMLHVDWDTDFEYTDGSSFCPKEWAYYFTEVVHAP